MSVLNFYQPDDRTAVVVVDTMGSRGEETSKLVALPHLGAIIAFRGLLGVGASVVGGLMLYGGSTFDEAAERLPMILDAARAQMAVQEEALATSLGVSVADLRTRADLGNAPGDGGRLDEALLVGPSARDGCIVAVLAKRETVDGPLQVFRDFGLKVGPGHDSINQAARTALATDAGALAFVREQIRTCAAGVPGYGGRAIVARLSPAGVTIRDLGPITRE